MNVLVTGGAGYIGSHTVVELINAGYEPIIVDDLSNAKEDVIDRIEIITGKRPVFYKVDCKDKEAMRKVFSEHKIDSVIHFAAYKAVGESVKIPLEYYRNNIDSTLTLMEVMEEFGCKKFVFSSSATVYGPNNPYPYKEDMKAIESSSPYGWTKVMIERILIDYVTAHPDYCAILLRYFNPIGSHESGLLGDDPNGIPNNLMPYISRVAAGQLEKLTIYGDDYPTPDGTCQRDYLHVVDLAIGHLKALEYAENKEGVEAINLGTGNGVSVMELVHAFDKANDMELPYVIGPRREGDLPAFWADAEKAKTLLGWEATHSVEDMCRSAWKFAKKASEK
ncbi:MAG: UDP-glucose 4-epimerase GalE [Oscillospiraceae bacterium]|nr:UDP-glucose 4-epimerase GalE [Oscillospiraceae bacterium]